MYPHRKGIIWKETGGGTMAKELIRLVDCCMAFDGEAVLDHINL